MHQVLTANRLSDGRVVFLTAAGEWSQQFDDAQIAIDDESAANMQRVGHQAEADCRVVDSYLVKLQEGRSGLQPNSVRERIRADGPSVQTGTA
jgi:hypothetical protein